MWPGSHPWGGVKTNDNLRHIAQPRASLSSWPPNPSDLDPLVLVHSVRTLWSALCSLVYLTRFTPVHAMVLCTSISTPFQLTQSENRVHHATGCKPVVSGLCTRIPVLCMCLHQRRQPHTIEQRHCQSQSNGCMRVGREGGEGVQGGGRSLCPQCSEGCQDLMWDIAGAESELGILGSNGVGWVALGKLKIGVPRT